jgi:hypothetical protein
MPYLLDAMPSMDTRKIKIINGSEHILTVEDAARRLIGLGLKVGKTGEALSIPYDIDYPFIAAAYSPVDDDMSLELRGTYKVLLALQRAVN